MKIIEKYKIGSLFVCSLLLLSATGLMWGCSTLKQKLNQKRVQNTILSHEKMLKNQEKLNEWNERELMKYFGDYAILVLKDGFRISDSGLIGNTAVLHYFSQAMEIEHQKDSLKVERLQVSRSQDEAQLTLKEMEKFEARESSSISRWWLLTLLPIAWFIYMLRRSF